MGCLSCTRALDGKCSPQTRTSVGQPATSTSVTAWKLLGAVHEGCPRPAQEQTEDSLLGL